MLFLHYWNEKPKIPTHFARDKKKKKKNKKKKNIYCFRQTIQQVYFTESWGENQRINLKWPNLLT